MAEVRLGRQRSPKNHFGDQMRPYLRAANVDWSGLRLQDVKSMNFTDAELNTYRLEPGDLLLGEASGSPREVGKPAIWRGEIADCAFQNTLIRVRPKGPDAEYLLHYFRHQARSGRFAAAARGVGIHHLGSDALAKWRVPLPPLAEQRRIAEVLDRTDSLRVKRREALALLDDLTQSIFLDMFGDLASNTRRWHDSSVLGDVAQISSGITVGRSAPSAPTRAVPYLAVSNVQDRYLDLTRVKEISVSEAEVDRYRLRPGDLLLTEGGDPDKLGRGWIWAGEIEECLHQNHIFRVRIHDSRATPLFVTLQLASQRGRAYFRRAAKQTTGIASINMTQLRSFPIVLPPLDRQKEFARAHAKLALHRERVLIGASEVDALWRSLQQRAFAGEL